MKKIGSRRLPVLIDSTDDREEKRKVVGRAMVARMKGETVYPCPLGHLHTHHWEEISCVTKAIGYVLRAQPRLTKPILTVTPWAARISTAVEYEGLHAASLTELYRKMREVYAAAIRTARHVPERQIEMVEVEELTSEGSLVLADGSQISLPDLLARVPIDAMELVFDKMCAMGRRHPVCRQLVRRLQRAGHIRHGKGRA